MKHKIYELDELPPWQDMYALAIVYKLDGIEVYDQLDDETKTKEWNGLGPDRLPKFIRDFLDKMYAVVLPAACGHDFRYVVGGTIDDFHKSNKELKKNMTKCIEYNRSSFNWLSYKLAQVRIYIAYKLCERYGLEGWNLKE